MKTLSFFLKEYVYILGNQLFSSKVLVIEGSCIVTYGEYAIDELRWQWFYFYVALSIDMAALCSICLRNINESEEFLHAVTLDSEVQLQFGYYQLNFNDIYRDF